MHLQKEKRTWEYCDLKQHELQERIFSRNDNICFRWKCGENNLVWRQRLNI